MKRLSMQLLLSALGVLVGIFCLFSQRPLPWFGAALIAGCGAVLFSCERARLARFRVWLERPRMLKGIEFSALPLVYGFLCVAVIVAIAAAMLPEAALGDWPVNHDHPVHLFKAWQLNHDFLADGRLWGWSHKWFAGYPAHYLYPIGADLWINMVRWASLGLLDFGQAYGIAFFLLWVLLGYSVYRFACVGFGKWVGVLAGILYMTDTASYRFGGWVYTAEWGVWPQALATGFTLLAMARLPQLMESKRWRDMGIFAFFLGASLLTHPAQILHFAIAAPLILIAYWIANHERPWPLASLRLACGYGLGILIGGLWVFPFLSVRKSAASYGELWTTTFEMGTQLFHLNLLPGTLALVMGVGLFGSIALLWSRKFHHILTALLVFAFLLAGSATVLAEFHLVELSKAFENVQFQRFSLMLKPYVFVAASYALTVIFVAVRKISFVESTDKRQAEPARGLMRIFVAAALPVLLITPFAVPYLQEFGKTQINRNLVDASQRPYQQDRAALVAWFKDKHPNNDTFFRVMTKLNYHDHSFVDLGTQIDYPIYKTGFTPVSNFASKMEVDPPQLLDALNIRYIIATKDLKQSYYELVEKFGELRLYRYKDWKESPFEVISGEGDVSLISFGSEEIVLKAEDNASGILRLNVSYFPRWSATLDGKSVPIEPRQLGNLEKTGFMTVDLKPGTYRFVFARSWIEWVSLGLFMAAMLMVMALIWADTRFRFAHTLRGKLDAAQFRAERVILVQARNLERAFCVVLIVGVAVGVGLAVWSPPLRLDDSELAGRVQRVDYDFGDHLIDATVGVDRSGQYRVCRQFLDYYTCSADSWNRVTQLSLNFGAGTIRRCIWAHPIQDSKLLIHFPSVPGSDAIVGYYGIAGTGKSSRQAPAEMSIAVDGIIAETFKSERAAELAVFEIPLENANVPHEITFEISSKDVSRRHFCFNAQAVKLSEN